MNKGSLNNNNEFGLNKMRGKLNATEKIAYEGEQVDRVNEAEEIKNEYKQEEESVDEGIQAEENVH